MLRGYCFTPHRIQRWEICTHTDTQTHTHTFMSTAIQLYIGLPKWLGGKEFACECRRGGFDPWIGKIPWRRKWPPSPEFLLGKFHGQRSLAGYSPCGCKDLDMT